MESTRSVIMYPMEVRFSVRDGGHEDAQLGRKVAERQPCHRKVTQMRRLRLLLPVCVVLVSVMTPSNALGGSRLPETLPRLVAELKGSDTVAQDNFGGSVAVSGSTVVISAVGHAVKAGRAYVFTRTATGWHQSAELKGLDTMAGDEFGAVAVSGSTIVVGDRYYKPPVGLGAPCFGRRQCDEWVGRAYVFTRTATGWRQSAELKGSDSVGGDQFGASVAISGGSIVVGAPGYNSTTSGGRAYVFTKTARGWGQVAEVRGSDTVAGNFFGTSVGISDQTIVVGALVHASNAGRAYVFTRTATGWHQSAELKPSDTSPGDFFGDSVAVSGPTVVVGAPGHASGRVYVFGKTATGWEQAAELKGSGTVAGDYFGLVAISGQTIVVGSIFDARRAGRAFAFIHAATGWRQEAELRGADTVAGDFFGGSVAVSGNTVVVGARQHASSAGRAYVFQG